MRRKELRIDPIEALRDIFVGQSSCFWFRPDEWCIRDAEILEIAARRIREELHNSQTEREERKTRVADFMSNTLDDGGDS